MIQALLQGKPFGHPLHTVIVHFPIGLFLISLVFDLATHLFEAAAPLAYATFYLIAIGIIAALAAAVTGLEDWSDIRADHSGKRTATTHMLLNLVVVVLFVANLIIRSRQIGFTPTPLLPLLLSLVAVAILMYSGYLGGLLVYDHGISIGRHRRHTPTPDRTIRISVPEGDQHSVPIAHANMLRDGATLRVDLDGNVLCIVRLGEEYYAFQEFCTHRFGPLSEGSFHGSEVQCPWHRSCFDVRSGKVTRGPAKVELKTYPIEVQDGMLVIETSQGEQGQAIKGERPT